MENESQKSYHSAHKIVSIVFIVVSLLSGIFSITVEKSYPRGLGGIAAVLAIPLLPVFRKIFHVKKSPLFEICIMVFTMLAFQIGIVANGYAYIPPLDKITHTLSGAVFALVGLCVAFKLRNNSKKNFDDDFNFTVFFGFCFAQFTAVVWEILEFLGFILFGHDAQHHLTTGVFDTMGDLISCLIGAALYSIALILVNKYRSGTNSAIIAPIKQFYNINIK